MKATSVCSREVWVVRMALYGSTTAVDTCGAGYTSNSNFGFLQNSTESLSNNRDENPEPNRKVGTVI